MKMYHWVLQVLFFVFVTMHEYKVKKYLSEKVAAIVINCTELFVFVSDFTWPIL